jgi:hypothetical protein
MSLQHLYDTAGPMGEKIRAFRDRAADKLVVFINGVPRVSSLDSRSPLPVEKALESYLASLSDPSDPGAVNRRDAIDGQCAGFAELAG